MEEKDPIIAQLKELAQEFSRIEKETSQVNSFADSSDETHFILPGKQTDYLVARTPISAEILKSALKLHLFLVTNFQMDNEKVKQIWLPLLP